MDMRKQYFEKLEFYSPTSDYDKMRHWWHDLMEIEQSFGTSESAKLVADSALNLIHYNFDVNGSSEYDPRYAGNFTFEYNQRNLQKVSNVGRKPLTTNGFKQVKFQSTCFPSDFVNYILKNASLCILQRLHQSAKCFYVKQPKLACRYFVIDSVTPINTFVGNSVVNFCMKNVRNLHVSRLYVAREGHMEKKISTIISSLYHWELTHICWRTTVNWLDLNIVLKNSNVMEARFENAAMLSDSNILVQVFISLFPNATVIK